MELSVQDDAIACLNVWVHVIAPQFTLELAYELQLISHMPLEVATLQWQFLAGTFDILLRCQQRLHADVHWLAIDYMCTAYVHGMACLCLNRLWHV